MSQSNAIKVNMVQILDSTLREGEQTPGVYFSSEEKMVIAEFLDQIGVDIIEAGNPAVDDEIALAIKRISQAGLKAKIGAHSLCKIDNVKKALLLKKKNLLVESPFFDFPKRGWNSGVEVSFVGYEIDLRPGEAYPIEGFTTAMNVNRLTKESAAIESFYYKQNGVCIGLKANTSMGSIKLNFPSIYAKKIMELEKRKEPITIYFDRFKGDPKSFLFPTIHGLICGRDTLRMEDNYYGDPDGDHDYSSISSKGVITKLNLSAKQKIVSLVVDERYLLEIDTKTESQLKAYLKKGKSIGFEGDQHIKKEGEVYQFDYQIVSPKKLSLEGREFLLYNR